MLKKYYSFTQDELPDGSFIYTFITHNDLCYSVEFDLSQYDQHLDNFPILLQQGYALNIFCASFTQEQKRKYDEGVRNTISMIIWTHFNNCGKDSILLFHCDHSDNKQRARHIVFNSWFNEGEFLTKYRKESLEFLINQDPPIKHYIGYLTMRENKFRDRLEEELERFSYFMIGAKS